MRNPHLDDRTPVRTRADRDNVPKIRKEKKAEPYHPRARGKNGVPIIRQEKKPVYTPKKDACSTGSGKCCFSGSILEYFYTS